MRQIPSKTHRAPQWTWADRWSPPVVVTSWLLLAVAWYLNERKEEVAKVPRVPSELSLIRKPSEIMKLWRNSSVLMIVIKGLQIYNPHTRLRKSQKVFKIQKEKNSLLNFIAVNSKTLWSLQNNLRCNLALAKQPIGRWKAGLAPLMYLPTLKRSGNRRIKGVLSHRQPREYARPQLSWNLCLQKG